MFRQHRCEKGGFEMQKYEAPSIVEVGSVRELTQAEGHGFQYDGNWNWGSRPTS